MTVAYLPYFLNVPSKLICGQQQMSPPLLNAYNLVLLSAKKHRVCRMSIVEIKVVECMHAGFWMKGRWSNAPLVVSGIIPDVQTCT